MGKRGITGELTKRRERTRGKGEGKREKDGMKRWKETEKKREKKGTGNSIKRK